MSHRLQVIEELKLDFEVPYITGRGEAIDSMTVPVNEREHGLYFSYDLLKRTGRNLDILFPAEGIALLGQTTKQILHDLGMAPARVVLQLHECSPDTGSGSVEGRAPVNRGRDTVLIILTKTPFVYKFGYEMVLWHQAMHAKDRWERRFPSAHPMVHIGDWMDALWHFSIEGRLQSLGRPHYTKEERLDEAVKAFGGLPVAEPLPALARRLGDQLWGNAVTLTELLQMGHDLGLGATEPG
ncbi:MAG: hypothetical protein FJ020_04745 [Chloroflexi bacterium]|nr:hypothetical protein [Chloroflexota bacterium]